MPAATDPTALAHPCAGAAARAPDGAVDRAAAPDPAQRGRRPAAARLVLGLLARLDAGTLDLQLPDGSVARFGGTAAAPDPSRAGVLGDARRTGMAPDAPRASMRLHGWGVFDAVLQRGDVGLAESWIDGGWSTPDLPALLALLARNRDAIERAVYGSWWGSLWARLRHRLRRNSRRGSRRNIHAHYDLGNPFYRLWLDESMSYSSAWFGDDAAQPLAQAQQAKLRRALRASGVQPGARLLEIGCGWGALAETAVREFGARVTGITLSTEQLADGRARLAAAGAAAQAELRLQDWRDVDDGPYDAIVSIEMFEAVGRDYWDRWFETLHRLLKPGASACVQTITLRDDLTDRYAHSTDFIQQYIFPGGVLPGRAQFRAHAAAAGLRIDDEFAFGGDYAETLRRWRRRFLAREGAVRELGFDTRFLRTWDFYLAYCEAAFGTGNTDVVQFTLRRAA